MAEPRPKMPAGTPKKRGPLLNIVLFLATMVSTWLVGAMGVDTNEQVANGLIYMASVIGILLSHEMGHYIMARRNRIETSLPYFIPLPFSLFGTLGAVIVMRGRIRSRNALMEVGAAGPLAGMVVAVPILLAGLAYSPVEPLTNAGLLEGQSLLYMLLKRIAVGEIPPGYDVMLHPMAWAGWIGLLVTMLNLLPIGQLDGGHIFYALWGKAHIYASRIFHAGLFLLGLGVMGHGMVVAEELGLEGEAYWTQVMTGGNWLFLGLILLIFSVLTKKGHQHPPTDDNYLSPLHRIVGFACLFLFVITFMPVPIRILI